MEEKMLRQILDGMDEIKQGQDELRQEVAEIKKDGRRINQSVAVMETDLTFKVNVVYENVTDIIKQNRKIDNIETKQEDHEIRIWALEQVVKASNQ
jgi:hemerythrin-like domain-containing protein